MSFNKTLSNIFKLVPRTKISLINGYIKENTDSNSNVPKEIVQLCAVSVFPLAGFATDYLGSDMVLYVQPENVFCQCYRVCAQSAFGKIKVSECGRYRCTFNVTNLSGRFLFTRRVPWPCMIGIVEDDENILMNAQNTAFNAQGGTVYGYDFARKMITIENQNKYGVGEKYGPQNVLTEYSSIYIDLDLDKNAISFGGNDIDFGIAFKNIPKKVYRFAISVGYGVVVQMSDFECWF